jgi:NAD(P)-dependent dehydrogenase (short-subunit alcohol dehydrogenase family)
MSGPADRGHVVITGTSTGIGAAAAVHLADNGFQVFAGVRHDADGEALRERASGELIPVMLDITDGAQITAAVERVTAAVGARGLAGLVNVAGIVKPAPLEFQPLADFREQLEVNLIGHLAVIQAFLPLIRTGNGRIVNVGSIGGLVVLPVHGAYSASKFGMEAISDALRLELRQWQIPVSLVDPGATDTAIFGKTLAAIDDLEQTLGTAGYGLYADQIAGIRKLVEKTASDPAPARELAETIFEALTHDEPKARYFAGKGVKEAELAARLPDHVRDKAVAKEAGLPAPE